MVHPPGRTFWMIFGTFVDLNSCFWMVFDGLFGSNRQNCSKTVEILVKAVRNFSPQSLLPCSTIYTILKHIFLYYLLLRMHRSSLYFQRWAIGRKSRLQHTRFPRGAARP